MGRADQLEALYEYFGGLATNLAASASVGDTSIQINASIPAGSTIELQPGPSAEKAYIKSITGTGPYTVTVVSPLQYDHATGTTVSTFITTDPSPLPLIHTLFRGEPLEVNDTQYPALIILAPKEKETRHASGLKWIDYDLSLVYFTLTNATAQGELGTQIVTEVYNAIDTIKTLIRENKQLITLNYPKGASIRFGENSNSTEIHDIVEEGVRAIVTITVDSREQVIGE